ncbi:sugar (pentulose or hexulose) kinase [Inquilinus ginsengisoli]|uniref:Sugar (Pentulose or hexulose) kinase n=1 Tax=Inquilinus ginsengisoli TaxID=363840 RepID=A0ABU1K0K7_9PROT|nr:FGGY-family carbohydrate kinase [Inquilinus ginsengisoli]MDR6294393.1 sugar (pentulose or hexulose) kinase [Inquilinus ginsengisoli]
MAETARAIGIDVGTSGVRAVAVDAAGRPVGRGSMSTDSPGLDPRDPELWWLATVAALRRLAAEADLSAVAAVAVDGTSGTVLVTDAAGRPVGPALMYNDSCPDEAVLAAIDAVAPAGSAARGRSSALARALVLLRRPGAMRVLHQADWIAGRLSGRFDATDENNALKTGYDPVARRWPDWIFGLGVAPGALPRAVAPGTPTGRVGDAAIGLGLPAEALVCAGTTDGCASFLATGADAVGDAVTALGSTLVIKLLSDRSVNSLDHGVYSHRMGDRWLVGGASNSGGAVIAQLFGRDRLPELTAALRPDRPTGLSYYPLPKPGERFPVADPNLPPVLEPRPADDAVFFQGVLEGIAAIEARAYRLLVELGAPAMASLRSVGGGAANAGWTEIRRRQLGVPFLPALSEDAAEGTARLALAGGAQ